MMDKVTYSSCAPGGPKPVEGQTLIKKSFNYITYGKY